MSDNLSTKVKQFVIQRGDPGIPKNIVGDPDLFFIHLERLKILLRMKPYFSDESIRHYVMEIATPELLTSIQVAFADSDQKTSHEDGSSTPERSRRSRKTRHSQAQDWPLPCKVMLTGLANAQLSMCQPPSESPLQQRLSELSQRFGLDQPSMTFIRGLFIASTDTSETRMIPKFFGALNRVEQLRRLSHLTGLSSDEINSTLRIDSPLMRFGLLDTEKFEPSDFTIAYLEGISGGSLTEMYFKPATPCEDGPGIDSFPEALRLHLNTMRDLIQYRQTNQGLAFLIYGDTGTGKTAAARALMESCREFGCEGHWLRTEPGGRSRRNVSRSAFRISAVQASELLDPANSILICDDAEDILCGQSRSTSSVHKGSTTNPERSRINAFLDANRMVCIFVVESHEGIDETIRRRFDYSVRVPAMGRLEMRRIWRTCLHHHELSDHFQDDDIDAFSRRWNVQAAGIDSALQTARTLILAGHNPVESVGRILVQHAELLGNKEAKTTPSVGYSVESLNFNGDIKPGDVLKRLTAFQKHRVAEKYSQCRVHNLNMLFSGPPGTGKTEFVRYAAEAAELELVMRSATEMLGMYVGNTESNIRRAFAEAESRGAILFLDEIDALLGDRRNAHRQYEVSQVNELLVQMDNFRGIFIAATNFSERLDLACLRRFTLKLAFDYLDDAGKKGLFNSVLKPLSGHALTPSEHRELCSVEKLTPGDFRTVFNRHALVSDGMVPNSSLIDELRRESDAQEGRTSSQTIGFASVA
jgi:transitional endoplasmic reticulum ATPase